MTQPIEFRIPKPSSFAPEPDPFAAVVEQAADSYARTLEHFRVPERFRSVPADLELHAKIANWSGEPWAVTILGPNGCGKTWQAIRMLCKLKAGEAARGLYGHGRQGLFADASCLVDQIRREIASPQDGNAFDEAARVPVLVLDDFAATRGTEFAQDRLSMLLRKRYNDMLPVILTSDAASMSAIADAEPRLASRLASGIVLNLAGRDRRLS